ncbi:hypothetical protein SynBOUM118_01567 [Synechococcus sp. BOUM118]|nr:hypothetical protein SynBOUM118_01567 [Synechococcus sp. BOUM118]
MALSPAIFAALIGQNGGGRNIGFGRIAVIPVNSGETDQSL